MFMALVSWLLLKAFRGAGGTTRSVKAVTGHSRSDATRVAFVVVMQCAVCNR